MLKIIFLIFSATLSVNCVLNSEKDSKNTKIDLGDEFFLFDEEK